MPRVLPVDTETTGLPRTNAGGKVHSAQGSVDEIVMSGRILTVPPIWHTGGMYSSSSDVKNNTQAQGL